MIAFLALVILSASVSSSAPFNDCGGVGPWCLDWNIGPQVVDGYVVYMHDGGAEAPRRLYAVLQTGEDRSLSVTVGAWGCDFQAGGHYEGVEWLELPAEARLDRALALVNRSVASVVETCGADPESFIAPLETFDEAFRLFDTAPS